ncbi:KR domain-containing protein [Myxococcus sp. MxC21-1]|nr:KR domain-containing protein [Myxococcus sp. MxC21-1]
MELARWLVSQGARHLLLMGRRAPPRRRSRRWRRFVRPALGWSPSRATSRGWRT